MQEGFIYFCFFVLTKNCTVLLEEEKTLKTVVGRRMECSPFFRSAQCRIFDIMPVGDKNLSFPWGLTLFLPSAENCLEWCCSFPILSFAQLIIFWWKRSFLKMAIEKVHTGSQRNMLLVVAIWQVGKVNTWTWLGHTSMLISSLSGSG